MSDTMFTDETLTAFLDGELPETEMMAIASALEEDDALVAQLDGLQVDFAAARDGFAALLVQAPAYVPAGEKPASNVVALHPNPSPRWFPLAAAAAIALVAGFGIGRNTAPEPVADKPGWISTVANYVKLYDKGTLWGRSPSPEHAARQVARVAQKLNNPLTLASLQTEELTYRYAQSLSLNGKPLAQFMFSDRNGVPVAICVLKSKSDSKPLVSKQVNGLNAAVFTQDGFAYLVIGDTNAAALQSIAKQLQVQM